ncbi:hypothetical protein SAMN05216228_11122 [Rhizobium tibeticum]|uniref:Uncharacterized protein n=1 Tax=Rhizobium tibeticum TaxID=501024 RepID=A0A1H8X7D4_9HYPH|nr:hypothetical protein RTCCBAU85039_6860 [Rhizobium tibeticum]SEP35846.1 hypothetical protein SAMN05216228_11122 [Rhizobium tibeticum]
MKLRQTHSVTVAAAKSSISVATAYRGLSQIRTLNCVLTI